MKKRKINNNFITQNYIRKVSDKSIICGISAVLMTSLIACSTDEGNTSGGSSGSKEGQQAQAKQNVTVVLQEQSDGSYKVFDEFPSRETRVIIKDMDGKERMLPQEEINKLVNQEAQKVENGTSPLVSDSGGGLGIGGAILASAAGAILGSYIGNKLFNNSNYQRNAQRNYSSPQGYQRSQSSFNRSGATSSAASSAARTNSTRSGFFNNSSTNSSSSSTARTGATGASS